MCWNIVRGRDGELHGKIKDDKMSDTKMEDGKMLVIKRCLIKVSHHETWSPEGRSPPNPTRVV